MYTSLDRTIINQLLDELNCLDKQKKQCDRCNFDRNNFEYCRNGNNIVVVYCPERSKTLTINVTNICLENLVCDNWINYLKKIAKNFYSDICYCEYTTVPTRAKCRIQQPRWKPEPIVQTTTVYKQNCPEVPVVNPTIIYEECSPCVDKCAREVPKMSHYVIVKENNNPAPGCYQGNLVEKPNHYFESSDRGVDYNNHVWNGGNNTVGSSVSSRCSSCQ